MPRQGTDGAPQAVISRTARACGRISGAPIPYLHFANKTELFREVVAHYLEQTESARASILAQRALSPQERVLQAFLVMHSTELGSVHLQELIESSLEVARDLVQASEQRLAEDVAAILAEIGNSRREGDCFSNRQRADVLLAASTGFKTQASDVADYRKRMATAIELICASIPQ